jgi:hypothetical protein
MTCKSLLAGLVLATAATTIHAQIVGTATDQKYGNTTIVYRDSNANDAQVLAQLEAQMGMGDVVRITDAPKPMPTKPASAKARAVEPTAAEPLETPAFDVLPDTPAQTLVAATDVPAVAAALATQSGKVHGSKAWLTQSGTAAVAAPAMAPTVEQTTETKAASGSKTVATNKASAANKTKTTSKSSQKTGKLYKPSKSGRMGRWFKTHRITLGGKSKYGCYRF